jgi:NAD(P)-dependent dehydrogenase (short-subunit alcohol dehydrogenase family)
MVKKALDKFGVIDILVNNAGVSSMAPILDMTEAD